MSKINIILVIVIVSISGCTVYNKTERKKNNIGGDTENLLQIVKKNNVTNENFFVQKARVQFSIQNKRNRFIANLKFSKPDIFLASIRLNAGIEISRIYYSKDSIIINDRINKKILYGKDNDIEGILGFSGSLIRLILGDLYEYSLKERSEKYWENDDLIVRNYFQGKTVETVINSKFKKAVSATIFTGIPDEIIKLEYCKFKKSETIIPQKIKIKDLKKEIVLIIRIEKFISPWEGTIEFVPGKGYEEKHIR